MYCRFLLIGLPNEVSAEEGCNTPKSGKADNGVNNTRNQRPLAAKEPRYQVKLKQTHETPVDRSNDRKNKCQSIQGNYLHLILDVLSMAENYKIMR